MTDSPLDTNPINTATGINRFHPFMQWLILIGTALLCILVFQGAGALIISSQYGITALTDVISNPDKFPALITPLKWLQLVSSLGGFLLPAVMLSYMKRNHWGNYLHTNPPAKNIMWVLGVAAVLLFLPIMAYVYDWNQNIHFGSLDKLFRDAEAEAALLTKAFLQGTSITTLVFNLVVVALTPAIAEEFFFRGAMQNLFADWFKNKHVAIFITAIIFSLFHGQMLGFFPRMLIGMLLGYIYVWSGSIWVNTAAHFVNNALQVVLYFLFQNGYSNFDTDKADTFGLLPTAVCTLIFLIVMCFIYRPKLSVGIRQ